MRQVLFIVIAVFFLASCGGESSTDTDASKTAPEAKTSENAVTLVLNGNDQMQFDKAEFKVKAGQKVTLTLNHTGKMAKEVMGHNFVLLKPGNDIATFGAKAAVAKDNAYIPEGDETMVHTALLGGGESDTITFDAPAKGTYDFICSFPGHYALMKGKFIVE